jgi:hypothetical protein
LPATVFSSLPISKKAMPVSVLPEITLRSDASPAPSPSVPMRLNFAPPATTTPLNEFARAPVPAAFVPMKLPAMTLVSVPTSAIVTPSRSLPEITLPAPLAPPPMVLPFAPTWMMTPLRLLPKSTVPVISVPM